MRSFSFIFFIILYSYSCFSQEVNKDEYEIYGKVVGEQGYQFYPINFTSISEFELKVEDSIFIEINKMPSKIVDLKKLYIIALKYSIGSSFKIIECDDNRQVYFSPIYFKNSDEAFFICITTDNLPKPNFFFYKAKKQGDKWELTDYYFIF